MIDEDPKPRPKRPHEIGQDLAPLSIEELDERIAALQAEIARLEAEKRAKAATRAAADLFFRREP